MRGMCAGVLLAGVLAQPTYAQTTDYAITPKAGAWLILVTSYTGSNAQKLANELVTEIRRDYKLPAYVFNRGAEERAKEEERVNEIRRRQQEFLSRANLPPETKLRTPRRAQLEDQYAVLVGGYPDIDTGRKELDKIRKLKPPSERLMHTVVVGTEDGSGKNEVKTAAANPFLSAFVVPNPVIPRSKEPVNNKLDPAELKAFNYGESFSLFNNPKPWTLVVKVYRGAVVVQSAQENSQSVMGRLFGGGNNSPDLLSAAAKQAHSLAELLRKLGYTSYVMHTRYESIVCVGGYNSVDDPNLVRDQGILGNLESNLRVSGSAMPLDLFPMPMPMQVPGR